MTTPAKKPQAGQATDEQLETVKLIATHKHAGVKLQEGDEIEVNSVEKTFLEQHKKIAGQPQEAAPAAKE